MTDNQMFHGITTTLLVMAAYVAGLSQGQRQPIRWREFFISVATRVTRRGIVWSIAVPTGWVLLFYAFIPHVWFSLGRWPQFGATMKGALLQSHELVVVSLLGAMAGSLFVVPIIFVGSLFLPRWRHIAVYTASYAAAVGLAFGALFLAPDSFLNWFFD